VTSDQALSAIRVKIARAKHHLGEVKRQIESFMESTPYKVGTKRDPATRKLIYYVAGVSETPSSIAAATGDVLQNLRSALDHLAFRLVTVGLGGYPPHPRKIMFPIADTQAQYQNNRDQGTKGARAAAVAALDAIQPYQGGNDRLWQLHSLNNIDKHRLLLTVGSVFHSIDLGADMAMRMKKEWPPGRPFPPMQPMFFGITPRQFPLTVGVHLFTGAADDDVNESMRFRFEVAFGEPGIVNGEPLLETLQQMADMVDNLAVGFKAHL
jgi:hypothetical protein